jgi:hypothetical protein
MGNEKNWLDKCCMAKKPHNFVSDLKNIVQSEKPYTFAQGNLVPVLGSIPASISPQGLVIECMRSSQLLRKSIVAKELGKLSKSQQPNSVSFVGVWGYARTVSDAGLYLQAGD